VVSGFDNIQVLFRIYNFYFGPFASETISLAIFSVFMQPGCLSENECAPLCPTPATTYVEGRHVSYVVNFYT